MSWRCWYVFCFRETKFFSGKPLMSVRRMTQGKNIYLKKRFWRYVHQKHSCQKSAHIVVTAFYENFHYFLWFFFVLNRKMLFCWIKNGKKLEEVCIKGKTSGKRENKCIVSCICVRIKNIKKTSFWSESKSFFFLVFARIK